MLFVCRSDGWLACVCRVKKDSLRARNFRSGCVYFEFENNIFTMSSLYLPFSFSVFVRVRVAPLFFAGQTLLITEFVPLSFSFEPLSQDICRNERILFTLFTKCYSTMVRAVFCPILVLLEHSLHSTMLRSHFACARFSFCPHKIIIFQSYFFATSSPGIMDFFRGTFSYYHVILVSFSLDLLLDGIFSQSKATFVRSVVESGGIPIFTPCVKEITVCARWKNTSLDNYLVRYFFLLLKVVIYIDTRTKEEERESENKHRDKM